MRKDINGMKTIGARREVCKSCGFTDISSGLTSSTPITMLVLGLSLLGLLTGFMLLDG